MRHRISWTFTRFNQHTDLDQLSMVALENPNWESVYRSADSPADPVFIEKEAV